jgi:hypothetical protein
MELHQRLDSCRVVVIRTVESRMMTNGLVERSRGTGLPGLRVVVSAIFYWHGVPKAIDPAAAIAKFNGFGLGIDSPTAPRCTVGHQGSEETFASGMSPKSVGIRAPRHPAWPRCSSSQ